MTARFTTACNGDTGGAGTLRAPAMSAKPKRKEKNTGGILDKLNISNKGDPGLGLILLILSKIRSSTPAGSC
jgi:hypothetical protein